MVFQPIDPAPPPFRRRFKSIPVRTLLPNLITLLALCAGLTAIRVAVENRLELALAAVVLAALLDGIDGRIARMLKGTSRFGAELDSLADFVNFGVAPAIRSGDCTTSNRRVGSRRWFLRSAQGSDSRGSM
jgi:CDP-diacylglycerol--serine O-phosphatidyltransferase